MNPQTALAASIDHTRLPGLSKLSTIANSGLSEIQPDASRGRVRYLVLVTDSFSVFLAGKNTGVDLAGDLVEQVAQGVMSQYKAVTYKPLWGKTLPILVAQARDAVDELWEGIKNEPWSSTVEIDVAVAWLGNELVGERGLFLNPAYEYWREKHHGPHCAAGDWREIADRVCTSIGELAALASGQAGCWQCRGCDHDMLGQPDPKRYQLPHQFDECMKKFFGYARSLGRKTISVSRIADSIPMFDAFHFREDSAQRKRLAEHIGHHVRVLIAEHIAAKVPASRFDEVHRKHRYKDTGKSFIPVTYQRAIGDAEAGARASKVKAALADLDPWDPPTCDIVSLFRRWWTYRCAGWSTWAKMNGSSRRTPIPNSSTRSLRGAKGSTSRPPRQVEEFRPGAIIHHAARGGAGARTVPCRAYEAAPH